jgi:DNA-binding CsgD family transcriptional regulator
MQLLRSNDTPKELTGRQKQILDLLALNMTSKQVALRLGIHSRTVDNHCVNIIRALGVCDRYDAVRFWSRIGAGQRVVCTDVLRTSQDLTVMHGTAYERTKTHTMAGFLIGESGLASVAPDAIAAPRTTL